MAKGTSILTAILGVAALGLGVARAQKGNSLNSDGLSPAVEALSQREFTGIPTDEAERLRRRPFDGNSGNSGKTYTTEHKNKQFYNDRDHHSNQRRKTRRKGS